MSSHNENMRQFKKNFINGTNYELFQLLSNTYKIKHKPTGSFVKFTTNLQMPKNKKYLEITEGNNPNNARGFGIGIRLRALATVFAIMRKHPMEQTGIRANSSQEKRNLPASTTLLRKYLKYVQHFPNTKTHFSSIYKPGNPNHNKIVKNAARTNNFNQKEYNRRRLARK
jgi:hypothetical protein